MSDRDNGPADAGADDDASLFNAIVGGTDDAPEAGQERNGDGEREPDDGDRGEGDGGEGQARERDPQGRFAKPEQRQDGDRQDRQGNSQDRAQRGLRGELTGERGRRQEAEAKAAAFERQLGEMRAQIEVLARQQSPGQQHQQGQRQPEAPKADAAPDRYTDPEAYDRWVIGQAEARAQAYVQSQAVERADYSLEIAKQRDSQAFDAAVARARGPRRRRGGDSRREPAARGVRALGQGPARPQGSTRRRGEGVAGRRGDALVNGGQAAGWEASRTPGTTTRRLTRPSRNALRKAS